ncbi:uncharacterized protein Dana_GF11555 [Drosophila ananassae]|uniref:Gustatory receptor n=1 Tax=Drosophila ananassae TaxID=7217 RepID=B3MBZ7_DROAN|nr:putative gustatory receptor 59b [Drosophila ananassae]EDV37184.2 uncharacterized protein Dana_GF11555 [Drosophila ananassae]
MLGITSYRLVNGRFRQSRITRAYAVIFNVLIVVVLPPVFLKVAKDAQVAHCFRKTLFIVPYVLYTVNYVVVVYILISRWYRDSVLVELQDLANKISRKIETADVKTSPDLGRLLCMKSFTLAYLTLSAMLWIPMAEGIWDMLSQLITIIAYCILNATTYLYFLSFWQVARGFDFINQQQERCDSEELLDLWALHSTLRRMASKINDIYGLQMLASRIDFIVFTIVFGYAGIIYSQSYFSMYKVFSVIVYWVRSLDFFLNDYISDLVSLYESQSNSSPNEFPSSKEMSAFLLYKTYSRSQLKVLGLYPANRNIWLRMVGFIICQSILLLQFYMILS